METRVSEPEGIFLSFQSPDYLQLYEWEKFDLNWWQKWFGQNWIYCVYLTVIYVALIYSGRIWMKNRQPYKLKQPLILWNVSLAAFSIVGFWRSLPELLHLLGEPNGFYTSCCLRERLNIGTVFWTLVISFSKVVELGDTAFIVLRKQPLIFLHWYHHATVMCYCWYTFYYHDPGHRWFMALNFFVHSVMYTYYALKAMGVKLPRTMAMSITSLQLLQMVVGVTVNIYSLVQKANGKGCQSETFNIFLALVMYASYFVLFSNFFNKAYFQKKAVKKE